MTTFDAEGYKKTTEEQWDSVAEHWNAWGALLDRWLGPATEILLDLCKVKTGDHVLHVAGGSGQDAIQTARRVGIEGKVVSTDFSAELTRIAQTEFQIQMNNYYGNVYEKIINGFVYDDTDHNGF